MNAFIDNAWNEYYDTNESRIRGIVRESVKRVLRESNVSSHEYNTLPLKDGGWDSYAFDYDSALDNAKSIEDWDDMMRHRDEISKISAENAQDFHPQATTLAKGWKKLDGGEVKPEHLKSMRSLNVKHMSDSRLELDSQWSKSNYGF